MAKRAVMTYLERLERNRADAEEVNYGALILAGIGGAATITAGLIGGTGAIAANIGYNAIENQVLSSETFEATNYEKRNAIVDDFAAGKISFDEYQARLEALYSKSAVVDFAKNSGDADLAQTAKAYEQSRDLGKSVLCGGVPVMAGFFGVGVAEYGISDYLKKKYERRIAEYKARQGLEGKEA